MKRFRIVLDVLMMVFSLILMGGNLLFPADIVHEVCGVVTFALWITHVVLNRRWYISLCNRAGILCAEFNVLHIMQSIINVGIAICALFLMISGIMISNHVFIFLHIEKGASFARAAHLLASHWYFIFMSLHVGMHAGMMVGSIKNKNTGRDIVQNADIYKLRTLHTKLSTAVLWIFVAAVCMYGIYAFMVRGIWKYLLYRQPFFFFDISRGYILFFVDYVCMMILIAVVSYLTAKIIRPKRKTR